MRRIAAILIGLALVSCGRSAGPEAPAAGRNLILFTLDTTRADHLSCYGGPEGLTPALDGIAAAGALFAEARSQTNVTNPSHSAIMTGLRALDADVLSNYTALDPEFDTIGAAFQRAGYRTAAFPASSHVGARMLDLPGFDTTAEIDHELEAAENIDRVIAWLEENHGDDDRPFFLWVHFFDPHMPYDPPDEYRERFYQGDPTAGDGPRFRDDPAFLLAHREVRRMFDEVRDREYPLAMYRAEIASMDAEIGRLLDHLDGRGILDETGILAVADHGESHGENGVFFGHGGLHESNLRIPMILSVPGFPGNVVVEDRVDHLDIVPTLATIYGLSMLEDGNRDGRDLTPLISGEPGDSEPVTALRTKIGEDIRVHEHASNQEVAVYSGSYKLLRTIPKEPLVGSVSLFDLADNAEAALDISAGKQDVVARLDAVTDRWQERGRLWFRGREFVDDEERERFQAEAQRLRMLGYLDYTEERADEESDAAELARGISKVSEDLKAVFKAVAEDPGLTDKDRDLARLVGRGASRELAGAAGDLDRIRSLFLSTVSQIRELTPESRRADIDARLAAIAESIAALE